MKNDPRQDPTDPAWRPPVDATLPFPPEGEVDHPNLKEVLYTHLEPGKVVVDVGCGTGPFEYHRYAASFIAFDMFEPDNREGLVEDRDEFRLGKLETFPIEDASCDAVILGFILEHVPDPARFMREAERVLRPGGWCYVAVPHYRSLEDRLFRLATTVAGSTRGPHIQKFTFKNFTEMVHNETSLRLSSWHLLRASFLFMMHPKLRPFRRPFIRTLQVLKKIGLDGFHEANYQFLFRKALDP